MKAVSRSDLLPYSIRVKQIGDSGENHSESKTE